VRQHNVGGRTSNIRRPHPRKLGWESGIEVDSLGSLAIELDKSDGTAVSDVAPTLEQYNRWAPVVTVEDAKRAFNRVSSPRGGDCKEAADYH